MKSVSKCKMLKHFTKSQILYLKCIPFQIITFNRKTKTKSSLHVISSQNDFHLFIYLFISLLKLKQNKPAPCRYCSGPLASGALNCRSANKGHKNYHYSGALVAQHLLFTSCDRFLTFSLHVLMSMLASRLATGTND